MNAPGIVESLPEGAAWIDRSDRERLLISGPDRAKFLHNVTTNDIKRLPAGRGCEAFVTNLQGKTLGYVTLLAADDAILLRTDPGALATVLPHFQKYGLFDDVSWQDQTAATGELHLIGEAAAAWLAQSGAEGLPQAPLEHVETSLLGRAVRVVRESPAGFPGLSVIGGREDILAIADGLRSAGVPALDASTFEGLRIEAGTPVFGRDISADNLPQEVGRDTQAISFVKGCYLGQETVARLDALGHVNRILKGLRIESDDLPAPGTPLMHDGKPVGEITSAGRSPRDGQAVALGYIRVKSAARGTILESAGGGRAVVADLPMRAS